MLETICEQQTIRRNRRAMALDLAAAVRGLHAAKDVIVQAELRRSQHRLGGLTPDQHQALQLLLSRIANKILRPVFRRMKRAADQGDLETVARICEHFGVTPLPLVPALEESSTLPHREPEMIVA